MLFRWLTLPYDAVFLFFYDRFRVKGDKEDEAVMCATLFMSLTFGVLAASVGCSLFGEEYYWAIAVGGTLSMSLVWTALKPEDMERKRRPVLCGLWLVLSFFAASWVPLNEPLSPR